MKKVLRLTAEYEAGIMTPADAFQIFNAALFNALPAKMNLLGMKAEIVELESHTGRML
jgi:hypothetical protein